MTPHELNELRAALEDADRRTLAAVLTHLSGQPDLIVDGDDRDELRRLALEILPEFLDGKRPVGPPDDDVLRAAMCLAADGLVPDAYGPFVREQMAIGPIDEPRPISGGDDLSILIIGAGVTGLAIATYLDRAGLANFLVLEKHPSPGGTWWANRYPGCRVDTPSLLYSYSFNPDPGWPHHFSYQPSLLKYMSTVAEGIGDRIRTSTEVLRLVWVEEEHQWQVTVRSPDGDLQELRADVVVGALGFLSEPRTPEIPGMEFFEGPQFHSGAWDPAVDVKGKRVAIIGTGASANQIMPAIVEDAAEIRVYQRSPHWVMPHPYYGKPLTGSQRWLIERVPTYMAWFRFRQFWVVGDGIMDAMRIDPSWPDKARSVNAENDHLRTVMTEYIRQQLADRPELIEKVTPSFPPYAKRMVIDNGWYAALTRSNVVLVTDPIDAITPGGVRTTAGESPVDVIVYATGFYTNHVLSQIEITGRGGVDVRARLDRSPEAYLGIALQDCPNLFLTSGPNGVMVHGGAGTLLAEMQSSYIVECLRHMVDNGWADMEIRPAALRRFTEECRVENAKYVWSTAGVTNWYAGSPSGGAAVALPWLILDFWKEAKAPDFSVYAGSPPIASKSRRQRTPAGAR